MYKQVVNVKTIVLITFIGTILNKIIRFVVYNAQVNKLTVMLWKRDLEGHRSCLAFPMGGYFVENTDDNDFLTKLPLTLVKEKNTFVTELAWQVRITLGFG